MREAPRIFKKKFLTFLFVKNNQIIYLDVILGCCLVTRDQCLFVFFPVNALYLFVQPVFTALPSAL